jgi:hypothetical protein
LVTSGAAAPVDMRLAERIAAAAQAPAAFLAGSLAAGLGNAGSDVDVYVVHDHGDPHREQLFTTSSRVDVHHLSREALTRAVDRVLEVRLLARGPGAGQSVREEDVRLCVALAQATVVVDSGLLVSLQRRLDDADERLRRAAVNHWLLVGASCQEDWNALRDSAEPDDIDAALHTARAALLAGCKALVAASGDLHFGPKWVPHQLSRSAPPGFPREELRSLSGAGSNPRRPWALPHALMSFAQTCLAAAGTVGWHGVALHDWPSWRRGDGALQREERFALRAYDDGAVLIGPGTRHVHLQPDVALVWALCNGTSARQLADHAGRLSDATRAYGELTQDRCLSLVRRLADAGLLRDTTVSAAVT